MTVHNKNSYVNHMYQFAHQPLKVFDCIDFFYNELDVEESKALINPVVKHAIEIEAKQHGFAMHNGCMPMRLTIMNLSAVMKTVTFDDKHIKMWKKGK